MEKTKLKSLLLGLTSLLALAASLLAATGAQAAPRTTYYHWDAVGSPVAATDDTGAVIWREEYHPYGERIASAPEASTNSRWYAGHPADPGTGLICMGARWYDPAVGRFISVDPVAFTEGNAQTFNRYAYANNNPHRYIDPSGGSVLALSDWYDFAKDVGGLLVTEIVYTTAVIVGDEGVQRLALDDMAAGWKDAAISTAGLASPVPGAGRAIKGASWGIDATRGQWKVTKEGTERIVEHGRFGKFFKSKSDGLWWSADRAGHGGSKWKVFEETSGGLKWKADADEFGDFIVGKHKSPAGQMIPWSELGAR
jgi:RHS repeat-associated protein